MNSSGANDCPCGQLLDVVRKKGVFISVPIATVSVLAKETNMSTGIGMDVTASCSQSWRLNHECTNSLPIGENSSSLTLVPSQLCPVPCRQRCQLLLMKANRHALGGHSFLWQYIYAPAKIIVTSNLY